MPLAKYIVVVPSELATIFGFLFLLVGVVLLAIKKRQGAALTIGFGSILLLGVALNSWGAI